MLGKFDLHMKNILVNMGHDQSISITDTVVEVVLKCIRKQP